MKIIVTGAAGLIGSHLCETLVTEGHTVVGLDNLSYGNMDNLETLKTHSKFFFIEDNIENINNTKWTDVDLIYHLAAYKKTFKGVGLSPTDVMTNNYNMMEAVLEYCKTHNTKLIFTSTSDVYCNSTTFKESDPLTIGPFNATRYSYAVSKIHDEQMCINGMLDGEFKGAIARIFGCASERSNKGWSGGHVPMFIDKALKNEPITIHGDGLQTRSISDARDIVNGLYSMGMNVDNINGEIINLGTNQEMTVKETAEYIIKHTNSKSELIMVPAQEIFGDYKEITRRFANTKKAEELIDYVVTITTEECIDNIIKHFS